MAKLLGKHWAVLEEKELKIKEQLKEVQLHKQYSELTEAGKHKFTLDTFLLQKFKKYRGILVTRVLHTWLEDFVDKNTWEVVSIERNQFVGYFYEGKYYKNIDFQWDSNKKEFNVILGEEDLVMKLYVKDE